MKNKIKTFWIITRESNVDGVYFEAVYENKPSLNQLSNFFYRKDLNKLEFDEKVIVKHFYKENRIIEDFGVYYLYEVEEGGFAILD